MCVCVCVGVCVCVCVSSYTSFNPVGSVQLPGGGGDAAFGGGEGGRLARLQRLQEGCLPLARGTNHNHLQQLARFCLSQVRSEVSEHRHRT